jgi:hypothetical protein
MDLCKQDHSQQKNNEGLNRIGWTFYNNVVVSYVYISAAKSSSLSLIRTPFHIFIRAFLKFSLWLRNNFWDVFNQTTHSNQSSTYGC